jgi:hypothetical protein
VLNDASRHDCAASKQVYASPVLTAYGDLATLTQTSKGSGSGKLGHRFDGRNQKT